METKSQGKRLVLGMDHNMDLLKEMHHALTHQLIETMYDQGLVPMITKLTRITTFSATLIDNILVDEQLQSVADCGILLENLSDHLPCYCILRNMNPHRKEDLEITSRDTQPKNIKALKFALQKEDVLKTDPAGTAEEQFNEFHDKLKSTLDHFLPMRTQKIPARKRRREPWLTSGLEISIKKCKTLYKNHIKDRTNDRKYAKYLSYNQQLKRTKRFAKRNYYTEACSENKKNSKLLWRTINKVIRRSNNKTEVIEKLKTSNLVEYNGQRIANELAKHFSTIGKEYAEKMKKTKQTSRRLPKKDPKLCLKHFHETYHNRRNQQTNTKPATKEQQWHRQYQQ